MKTKSFDGVIARNVEFVLECTTQRPKWAILLGSGLAGVAGSLEYCTFFPFESLYDVPRISVSGHISRLAIGLLGGESVAVFQGRPHIYERLTPQQTLMTVRISAGIGVRNIILTNAAGGLNGAMTPGDLMAIQDHINLMPPQSKTSVSRHIEKSEINTSVYDVELTERFVDACYERGIKCHRGVYAGLSGPAYETPSEARYLTGIGADAVGMSTVNEALEARALGMRVIGVSCISNVIGASMAEGPDHAAVLKTVEKTAASLPLILKVFFRK
jgi:purine-nucleoside phosphorylase